MKTPSEMKGRFIELSKQDGYIDGIFNYCDRWCERCSFTSKCRNYAFSEGEDDKNGEELFAYLDNVFKATMMMLEEMMAEMNIDLEKIREMELPEMPDPEKHPLCKRASALSKKMHDWLQKNKPGELPFVTTDEVRNVRYRDSIEVIYWYNFFVSVKISRALLGVDGETEDEIQNDSNGSAKIALISLDRLIGAWSVLMENMKDHEDEILKFLLELAAVRKSTEETFPDARKFVRPGFDEHRS